MIEPIGFFILIGIFVAAVLYSSVGHAGASGYIAVMALAGLAPDQLKPAALILNILVASIASVKYYQVNAFSWKLLWPLIVTSIPCAFLGGAFTLATHYYKPILGFVLIYAAAHSFLTAKIISHNIRPPHHYVLFLVGAMIGFLSGLIGVGGGIFLSPILLFLRWGETRVVSGVAAAFILVNSIFGLAGVMTKQPELPVGLSYWAIAAIAGGWLGSEFGSKQLHSIRIRQILSIVLFIAGAKILFT
jgi:uncharacterized membrane protein YfcA